MASAEGAAQVPPERCREELIHLGDIADQELNSPFIEHRWGPHIPDHLPLFPIEWRCTISYPYCFPVLPYEGERALLEIVRALWPDKEGSGDMAWPILTISGILMCSWDQAIERARTCFLEEEKE
jgi:hypothetical protein